MKIGIFDSGLGGLIIVHSLIQTLSEYDYLYLGDTARVPYGNRSQKVIYQFTEEAVDFLFRQDCQLIIVACNTASAEALRTIQQEYLPKKYPHRRVLGVIIPSCEAATADHSNRIIGILATQSTVSSGAYLREIHKLNAQATVYQQATPLLVPLIENDGLKWLEPILDEYLKPLKEKQVNCLILGCTHYPIMKNKIRQKFDDPIQVISQDEVIPAKLKNYLDRHPEIESKLSKDRRYQFFVTDLTKSCSQLASRLFIDKIALELTNLK